MVAATRTSSIPPALVAAILLAGQASLSFASDMDHTRQNTTWSKAKSATVTFNSDVGGTIKFYQV